MAACEDDPKTSTLGDVWVPFLRETHELVNQNTTRRGAPEKLYQWSQIKNELVKRSAKQNMTRTHSIPLRFCSVSDILGDPNIRRISKVLSSPSHLVFIFTAPSQSHLSRGSMTGALPLLDPSVAMGSGHLNHLSHPSRMAGTEI